MKSEQRETVLISQVLADSRSVLSPVLKPLKSFLPEKYLDHRVLILEAGVSLTKWGEGGDIVKHDTDEIHRPGDGTR